MALTAQQQAAIDRARGISSTRDEDEDENQLGLSDGQKAAIERARSGANPSQQSQTQNAEAPTGLFDSSYNAGARGLTGSLMNIPNVVMTEDLSKAASYERDRAARDAAGELPWWERILTARFGAREDSAVLEEQAAAAARAAQTRYTTAQSNYPMSEGGREGLERLQNSETFSEGLMNAVRNPLQTASGVAQVALEQAPTIAAATALRNPTLGVAAFGSSAYAQERYGQLIPEAAAAGYDLLNPESAKAMVQDTAFMERQAERGRTRGSIIAAVDMITAGLASKTPLNKIGLVKNTGVQIVGGGGGEAAAEYADTGEINPGEVLVEALAEGVSAPLDVAAFAVRKPKDNGPNNSETKLNPVEAKKAVADNILLQLDQQAKVVLGPQYQENQPEVYKLLVDGNVERFKSVLEAAQQRQEEAQTAVESGQKKLRREVAKTFTPEKFQKERNAQRTADLDNPETEIGAAFEAHLDKSDAISQKEIKAEQKAFMDSYLEAVNETPETIREEYKVALDQRIEQLAADPEANPEAEAATPSTEQAKPAKRVLKRDRLDAETKELLGPNALTEYPELQQASTDVKKKGQPSKYEKLRTKILAERETEATTANALTDVAVPDTMAGKAFTFATEKLGKGWENDANLSNLLSEEKYGEFQKAVEAKAKLKVKSIDDAKAAIAETTSKLRGNQKKVFDVIAKSLTDFQADKYIQPNVSAGKTAYKINYQDLADDAGLAGENNRSSAQKAFAQVRPKLFEAMGLNKDNAADFFKMYASPKAQPTQTASAIGSDAIAEATMFSGRSTPEAQEAFDAEKADFEAEGKDKIQAVRTEKEDTDVQESFDGEGSGADKSMFAANSGFNTKASANQGVSGKDNEERSEAEKIYQNKEAAKGNTVADQRAAERVANRETELAEAVKAMEPAAIKQAVKAWNDARTEGSPTFAKLKASDQWEILSLQQETQDGVVSDEQAANELRDIETKYEPTGGVSQGDIDVEDRTAAEQSSDDDGSQSSEGGDVRAVDGTTDSQTEENPESFTAGKEKTAVVETKRAKKLRAKFGFFKNKKDADYKGAPTASQAAFEDIVEQLTGKRKNFRVKYYDDVSQVIAARLTGLNAPTSKTLQTTNAFGFVSEDSNGITTAHFILDRIPAGAERAAFMHEVASHIGIDGIIPEEDRLNMEAQINRWAGKQDNSIESIIANRALRRVDHANQKLVAADEFFGFPMSEAEMTAETIAYFIEEATIAGIEPTVKDPIGRFVRDLYARFKRALRTLGFDLKNLTAQDVVDLSWGAARMSLAARKHGTVADFRKFNHMYMSSGEGAQAYGWGSYLAERFSIARWYLRTDEERKTANRKRMPEEFNIARVRNKPFKQVSKALQLKILNPYFPSKNLDLYSIERDPKQKVGGVVLIDNDGYDSNGKKIPPYNINSPKDLTSLAVVYRNKAGKFVRYPVESVIGGVGKMPDSLMQELESIKDELYQDQQRFNAETTAEGNLLTVDTTVSDKELLPWVNEVSSAPQVLANLEKLFKKMKPEDVLPILFSAQRQNIFLENNTDITNRTFDLMTEIETGGSVTDRLPELVSETLDTVTGRELYRAMEQFEQHFPNELAEYLSAEALRGNAFSQGFDTMNFNDDVIGDDGVALPSGHYNPDKVASMVLDEAGVKGTIYADAGTLGRMSDEKGSANNTVIFNDNNLIVVSRTPGSKVDDDTSTVQEMRFGVNEDWNEQTFGATGRKVMVEAREAITTAARSTMFLHDLVRKVRDTMPAIGKWYDAMLRSEAVRNEIRMSFESTAAKARDLKPERLALVNDFLGKSTFFQKWGYDPEIEGKKVKVDLIMARAFGRLEKNEQALVKEVFAHGEKMRARKKAIAKALGVDGKFFTDAALEGPYAPLKRFGNWVAELKSAKLIAAENALDVSSTAKNRKAVEELKSDENNYIIRFFDTKGSAEQFNTAKTKQGLAGAVTKREPDIEQDSIGNPAVYEKILGALNAGADAQIDPKAKSAFAEMIKNLYFQSLDERSARLSGSRRMNRAGYEPNMMRSFLSHARAEAGLIAQMETGAEINAALAEARKELKPEGSKLRDPERSQVYNLVLHHYRDGLVNRDNWWTAVSDRVAAANSVYMLTSSVGYHATNATQPAMVTVPRIAGDFNNYNGAWTALFKGYGVARNVVEGSLVKQATTAVTLGLGGENRVNIDVSLAPPEHRKMLENLQLRQLLDVGMEEDLAEFDRFNTGFAAFDKASEATGKIATNLYQVARYVEAQNRIAAAIAAHDLALKNPKRIAAMKMTPAEYAAAVVEDTQGNFSRLDAPMLLKALPKLSVQYRKYQVLMAWHYAKAFKQVVTINPIARNPVTPQERAAGARVLAYSLAHAGVFAGATGLPLLSTAFWLTTFIGDEDEPDDLERWIKRNIDDGKFGDMLSRGVFSSVGVDLSTKLNQSKIFHPLPYVDWQQGESGAKDIFFNAVAGPSGSTAVNFFRAHEYFAAGDIDKGIEYSVPKGIRSVAETYRLATEGYTDKIRDVLVHPYEFDASALLLNSLGIPSSQIQEIKWKRGQQYELTEYFKKQTSKITKEYVSAYKDRNVDAMRDLRDEWRDLQKAKDRVRPFFGTDPRELRRSPLSNLVKAPIRRSKEERKKQRRFAE